MTEIDAEVVEEHVPEIKWPERVLIVHDLGAFKAHTHGPDVDMMAKWARDGGVPYRILRVHPPCPPKKQRVEIDWGLVEADWNDHVRLTRAAFVLGSGSLRGIIQRHARILEVPKT